MTAMLEGLRRIKKDAERAIERRGGYDDDGQEAAFMAETALRLLIELAEILVNPKAGPPDNRFS